MVYIDTDTVADVREIVRETVQRKAIALVNSVTTHRQHPTFVTRAMLKADAAALQGAYDVYIEVMHWENLDADLAERVREAKDLVAALYGRGAK